MLGVARSTLCRASNVFTGHPRCRCGPAPSSRMRRAVRLAFTKRDRHEIVVSSTLRLRGSPFGGSASRKRRYDRYNPVATHARPAVNAWSRPSSGTPSRRDEMHGADSREDVRFTPANQQSKHTSPLCVPRSVRTSTPLHYIRIAHLQAAYSANVWHRGALLMHATWLLRTVTVSMSPSGNNSTMAGSSVFMGGCPARSSNCLAGTRSGYQYGAGCPFVGIW